jgi:glucokinase
MSKLRTVIALDVGGTNTRCALIDEKYNIIKVIRERTNRGSVDGFLNQIRKIITSLNARKYNPLGIICGVPGKVEANGYIPILPNIHIENIPLKEYLEKYFSLPIIVRNDAEIAAVAEGYLGSGKAAKSTYFITISTGIGGCYFENNRIKNIDQEIGHTVIRYKNNFYEFEKIASGDGLVKLAELNNVHITSSYEFFDRLRVNDPDVTFIFNDWLSLISNFIHFVNKTYKPEVFAFTGGIMHQKDLFFPKLQALHPNLNLVEAEFSFNAGIIGAAALGFLTII